MADTKSSNDEEPVFPSTPCRPFYDEIHDYSFLGHGSWPRSHIRGQVLSLQIPADGSTPTLVNIAFDPVPQPLYHHLTAPFVGLRKAWSTTNSFNNNNKNANANVNVRIDDVLNVNPIDNTSYEQNLGVVDIELRDMEITKCNGSYRLYYWKGSEFPPNFTVKCLKEDLVCFGDAFLMKWGIGDGIMNGDRDGGGREGFLDVEEEILDLDVWMDNGARKDGGPLLYSFWTG